MSRNLRKVRGRFLISLDHPDESVGKGLCALPAARGQRSVFDLLRSGKCPEPDLNWHGIATPGF